MAVLEGTIDFWLEQGTALQATYERAEPFLIWGNYIRPVQESSNAFVYQYDAVGMSADPLKATPAHVAIGGDFPEIDISRPTYAAGMTEMRGFSVRIKYQQVREAPKGVSEIQRAYKFAGFWMAQHQNAQIIAAMKAGFTTASMTPTAVWSAANAVPIDDMEVIEAEMDREGYPYAMTDLFVHKTNWYEAKRYLTSVDISSEKQRSVYGVPAVHGDRMTIPVVDADLVKIKSGITEGSFLALDRNNPGCEYHYYNDPKFSTNEISYETVIDGKKQTVTATNLGFHFEAREDPDNHDQILKFWSEAAPKVTQAYAGLYKSTGI